jgi:hypothetical protein
MSGCRLSRAAAAEDAPTPATTPQATFHDNVALYEPKLSWRQNDLLNENVGGGRFRDASAQSDPGFKIEHVGRGSAVLDFDDGDLGDPEANRAVRLYEAEARP